MEILTVNVGTSSIKTALFETSNESVTLLAKARSYPLTNPAGCSVAVSFPTEKILKTKIIDFEDGIISTITAVFDACGKLMDGNTIIGIRIVHGGEKLTEPTRITPDVYSYLDEIKDLAPLHNPPALRAVAIIQEHFPNMAMYAVFDTAFHTTMPKVAKSYAVPKMLEDLHIRRFGFHGLAHASMLRSYLHGTGKKKEDATIITVQLGSGCSVCAIKNGISVETSMGFSPLEGLVSRTRSGLIDPAILPYLEKNLHETTETIVMKLNKESGLAGMTGTDGEISRILELEAEGNLDARHATALFLYRILQYLGSYDAVLGKADAFVFGGGVIEHNTTIWQRLLSYPFFSMRFNLLLPAIQEDLTRISIDTSPRHAYIAKVDEEKEIAVELQNRLTNT